MPRDTGAVATPPAFKFVTPLVFTAASNVQSTVLHVVIVGSRGQANLV
jgi:hypothetical protein